MYVNVFATLFSLLAPRGRTQEFLTHNNLRIFHYFPVILLWDFFRYAPISSYFQLQHVYFNDTLT